MPLIKRGLVSQSFEEDSLRQPVLDLEVKKLPTDSPLSRPKEYFSLPVDRQLSNLSVTNNDNIMTIKKKVLLLNLLKEK